MEGKAGKGILELFGGKSLDELLKQLPQGAAPRYGPRNPDNPRFHAARDNGPGSWRSTPQPAAPTVTQPATQMATRSGGPGGAPSRMPSDEEERRRIAEDTLKMLGLTPAPVTMSYLSDLSGTGQSGPRGTTAPTVTPDRTVTMPFDPITPELPMLGSLAQRLRGIPYG